MMLAYPSEMLLPRVWSGVMGLRTAWIWEVLCRMRVVKWEAVQEQEVLLEVETDAHERDNMLKGISLQK